MTDPKWEFWKLLAEKWEGVLDSYIRKSYISEELHEDLPYWHSERASTGFLAAAVWKIDGAIAIEEFYTKRLDESTQKSWEGHCDLWGKYRNLSFSAEVKQLWGKAKYSRDDMKTMITEAEGQLKTLDNDDKKASTYLFSICFISPMVDDKTEFDYSLKEVEEYSKGKNCQVFYYDARYLNDNILTWRITKKKWPGVIMLVKDSTDECKSKESSAKR